VKIEAVEGQQIGAAAAATIAERRARCRNRDLTEKLVDAEADALPRPLQMSTFPPAMKYFNWHRRLKPHDDADGIECLLRQHHRGRTSSTTPIDGRTRAE
jgi:hypothetical protein